MWSGTSCRTAPAADVLDADASGQASPAKRRLSRVVDHVLSITARRDAGPDQMDARRAVAELVFLVEERVRGNGIGIGVGISVGIGVLRESRWTSARMPRPRAGDRRSSAQAQDGPLTAAP